MARCNACGLDRNLNNNMRLDIGLVCNNCQDQQRRFRTEAGQRDFQRLVERLNQMNDNLRLRLITNTTGLGIHHLALDGNWRRLEDAYREFQLDDERQLNGILNWEEEREERQREMDEFDREIQEAWPEEPESPFEGVGGRVFEGAVRDSLEQMRVPPRRDRATPPPDLGVRLGVQTGRMSSGVRSVRQALQRLAGRSGASASNMGSVMEHAMDIIGDPPEGVGREQALTALARMLEARNGPGPELPPYQDVEPPPDPSDMGLLDEVAQRQRQDAVFLSDMNKDLMNQYQAQSRLPKIAGPWARNGRNSFCRMSPQGVLLAEIRELPTGCQAIVYDRLGNDPESQGCPTLLIAKDWADEKIAFQGWALPDAPPETLTRAQRLRRRSDTLSETED